MCLIIESYMDLNAVSIVHLVVLGGLQICLLVWVVEIKVRIFCHWVIIQISYLRGTCITMEQIRH